MIKLTPKNLYHGPSPKASEPVIVIELEIARPVQERASELTASMTAFSSSWFENTVDPRLPADLYLGQFLASWSLAALNRRRGYLHESGAERKRNSIEIWLAYHSHTLAYECLGIAARFLIEMASGKLSESEADSILQDFWKKCRQRHPDSQVKVLMTAARHAGIPYTPYLPYLPGKRYWQFGWGENALVFFECSSSREPRFGTDMAGDKALSKLVMSKLGIPIARHVLVKSEKDLPDAAAKIGWPCVAKPLDGHMAKGVTTDIRSADELLAAFRRAKEVSSGPVMIETHLPGDVYRLLVVRGDLLVAVRRECPYVIANGHSSVKELVRQLNQRRSREGANDSLKAPVPQDKEYIVSLSKQNLAPDSTPEAGRKVVLRRIPFQNVGGINTNVTESVHRDVRVMAESLSKSLDIQIAGLDYVTEDISKSYLQGGAVVEINLDPALPPMLDEGLSEIDLGLMVLGDTVGRIPVDLLLVQPDKLAEFATLLPRSGELGWVCGGQVGIGATKLATEERHFTEAVANLLKNRAVSSALIILTLKDILGSGLPVSHLEKVLLQDQAVDAPWRRVLEKHSEQVVNVTTPIDVAELIFQ